MDINLLRIATGFFGRYEVIGQGNTSYVYKGTLGPNKFLAVKRLKNYAKRIEDYESELGILARLKHPHVINVVGRCAHREERNIVYEFMPLRTLRDWLYARIRRTGEVPLDWRTRMEIGAGIAKGLMYLHTKGIIYRGLRPGKVLLGEGYRPKLFDFKCAVSVPSGGPLSIVPNDVLVGPYPYRAPEVSHINKLVTSKADVYSFGVVLRQMISGLERGSNWLHPDSFELRPHREIDNVFPIENWMKATTLVNQCMQEIPESRPEMSIVEQGMRFLANEPNVIWPVELAEPRI